MGEVVGAILLLLKVFVDIEVGKVKPSLHVVVDLVVVSLSKTAFRRFRLRRSVDKGEGDDDEPSALLFFDSSSRRFGELIGEGLRKVSEHSVAAPPPAFVSLPLADISYC